MLDVVRWPKGPIEGPGSTQLKGQLCRWWLITTSPDITNGSWRDTFEDVTRGCAADQRLSENETDGGLGELFETCVGKIRSEERRVGKECRYRAAASDTRT